MDGGRENKTHLGEMKRVYVTRREKIKEREKKGKKHYFNGKFNKIFVVVVVVFCFCLLF